MTDCPPIVGPIMAAVLSGLPGMAMGVGVITDPGARVDCCASGLNPDPSPESSGRVRVRQKYDNKSLVYIPFLLPL